MEIVWTHRAKDRLKGIYKYISSDQPLNADNLVNRIIDRAEKIIDQPRMGRLVPEYENSNIREVIEGNYRIIYFLQDHRIDILTVRHCSQLLSVKVEGID